MTNLVYIEGGDGGIAIDLNQVCLVTDRVLIMYGGNGGMKIEIGLTTSDSIARALLQAGLARRLDDVHQIAQCDREDNAVVVVN